MIYYQIKDSVFSADIETKETKLVYVFPDDFKASITTVNRMALCWRGMSSDKEKELFKNNPNKSSYFNIIYEAKLPRTLFTLNVKTSELIKYLPTAPG